MRIVRIVATLVTGTTMLLGGAALTLVGPPLVVVLGAATGAVGIGYVFVGLTAERAMRQVPEHHLGDGAPHDRGSASTSEVRTAPESARKTASASSS